MALLGVLEDTEDAIVASHVLHWLRALLIPGSEVFETIPRTTVLDITNRLVNEAIRHKHHLQDAAVYSLGSLLSSLLSQRWIQRNDMMACIGPLNSDLSECNDIEQCQVLLTVLSCLSGNETVRKVMALDGTTAEVLFGVTRRTHDSSLQARSMSLMKVLGSSNVGRPECSGKRDAHGVSAFSNAHSCEHPWYFGGRSWNELE